MSRKSLLAVATLGFATIGIAASPAAPISPIALAGLSSTHKAQLVCPASGGRCYWPRRKLRGAYGYGPSYGYGYGPTFGFASTW
jgi:hypothetical protein